MNASQQLGIIVSVITIVAAFGAAVRWLVKHYLFELKNNGGSSLKDKVERLELKVDLLADLVKELIKK